MPPAISILVPVYNSEAYLPECIRSAQSQTHRDFELLLIDDGSTDNSRSICEEAAGADQRIRCLPRDHAGVAAARNAGIRAAQGKYLFFLDSDDAIHPCLLATLYGLLEKERASMATEFFTHAETTQNLRQLWLSADCGADGSDFTLLSNPEAINCLIREKPFSELGGIGGYMIRKSAVQSRLFDERLSSGEDTLFLYQLLSQGADLIVLKLDWYCYRTHPQQCTKRLSLKALQSMYFCQTCVRDSELAAGRTENAVIREGRLINLLALWYAESRRETDRDCEHFIKGLIKAERKWPCFSRAALHSRISLFLACRLPPLYWVIHTLWALIEKR